MTRNYNFCVKDKVFSTGTHVMGIINVTPDSFYAQSRVSDGIVRRAEQMIRDGAEILDIGGQSTRPSAQQVGALEEMSRVVTAVRAVRERFEDIPISVDTFYADVAEQCLLAGADMINDVSGICSKDMIEVIASSGASVCFMHNRRESRAVDMFIDKETGFNSALKRLIDGGVDKNKIMLDGGIGFNKSNDEDWALLNGYDELIDMFDEYPFLLGTSRKSMFGGDVSERLSATLESTRLAVKQGVLFVRVHDVAENIAMIKSCTR